MRQVCLYCDAHLGAVGEASGDDGLISHGVCSYCFSKFMAGSGQSLADFLDSLPGPVLVVDKDVRAVAANSQGLNHVSQDMSQIEGRLGGEVFECKYAKLPGGCGRTIHCKTCTIRKTVTKTHETGESCTRVPAYMDLGDIIDVTTIRFLISTEKVNDVVLLRIDDAQPGRFNSDKDECGTGK